MQIIRVIFLLFLSLSTLADCPTSTRGDDPSLVCQSSYASIVEGFCSTSSLTDNIYKSYKIDNEPHSGSYCNGVPSTKTFDSISYTKGNCTSDSTDRRIVWYINVTISCEDGYAGPSQGICTLIDECPAPTLCEDGLPPDASLYLDPPMTIATCDRADLKYCSVQTTNDTVIYASETCPLVEQPVCADYLSCYSYAFDNSSCNGVSSFDFTYTDPDNFSFTCTAIDPNSPDHPDNGGNADGNPTNDPFSTPPTNAQEVDLSNLDMSYLASAIADEIAPHTSAIENAIRSGNNTLDQSLQQIINDLGQVDSSIDSSASSTQTAIDNMSDNLENKLSQIADNTAPGACDPKALNYLACIANAPSTLPAHQISEFESFNDVNQAFKNRLDSAPVVLAFDGFKTLINFNEEPTCPTLDIDLTASLGQTISASTHCDLMEQIKPIYIALMSVFWLFIGFRIFASA